MRGTVLVLVALALASLGAERDSAERQRIPDKERVEQRIPEAEPPPPAPTKGKAIHCPPDLGERHVVHRLAPDDPPGWRSAVGGDLLVPLQRAVVSAVSGGGQSLHCYYGFRVFDGSTQATRQFFIHQDVEGGWRCEVMADETGFICQAQRATRTPAQTPRRR